MKENVNTSTYDSECRVDDELVPNHMTQKAAESHTAADDQKPQSPQPPAAAGEVVCAVKRAVLEKLD